jgi:hypothetical protein
VTVLSRIRKIGAPFYIPLARGGALHTQFKPTRGGKYDLAKSIPHYAQPEALLSLRLVVDTARAATSGEVIGLRREATALKEVVADLTLENRPLKRKRDGEWGGRRRKYPASDTGSAAPDIGS